VALKERIALIIEENCLKQKELAILMGVTESYVSTLLSGRNPNLSTPVANLIEEKLGYSAQWILSGSEPKFKRGNNGLNLSDMHQKAIFQLEKMSDEQVRAVLVFLDSLDEIQSAFKQKGEE
jgi:transcriptional regulator with XRE-family HTH domain